MGWSFRVDRDQLGAKRTGAILLVFAKIAMLGRFALNP
jgi:hypothetical protein